MPKLRDTFIPIGGVSQEPAPLRDETRVATQEQAVADPYLGLVKRPPIVFEAAVPTAVTTAISATEGKTGIYERPDGTKYWVAVSDGVITVNAYDGGAEVTLDDESGTYLDGGTDFELLQVGEQMWVVNKSKTVLRTDDVTANRTPQAIVYVRQGDFATYYKVTLDGVTVSYNTPKASAPEDRFDVGTDDIATSIRGKLVAGFGTTNWTFTQYGSTIHIERTDDADFTITGEDGLADRGMVIVKDSVQRFEDLPLRCKDGFICEVTGDPGVAEDNYWVEFQAEGEDDLGVWKEVAKPGTFYKLDPTTMPHVLDYQRPEVTDLEAAAAALVPLSGLGDPTVETLEGSAWVLSGGAPIDISATQHLEYLENTISATSKDGDLLVYWALDTSQMETGLSARVQILVDGVTEHEVEYARRDAMYFGNTTITMTSGVAGSTVRVRLYYSNTVTPDLGYRAQLYAGGSASYPGELEHDATFSYGAPRTITFAPGTTYPGDWETNLQIGTDSFTYTVTGATQNADTAAAGLQALVNADPDWVATVVGNVVSITAAADGTAPSVVALTATYPNTTNVWFRASSLSGYVGSTLRNLTSGASGTITSVDGETVIVSGGLTGGSRATMLPGDSFEIGQTGVYFGFGPAVWDEREAGDMDLVPFPSFLNSPITGIFNHEGRVGLISRKNIVLSRAGDIYNFFRRSARVLLDDDPVDVTATGPYAGAFTSALNWSERIFLVNEKGLFLLTGDPILTPRTVQLLFAGKVDSTTSVKPVIAGDMAFFLNAKPTGVEVNALAVGDNLKIRTIPLTRHCPTYIPVGSSYSMTADEGLQLLCLSDGTDLFFLRWNEDGLLSWSKSYLATTTRYVDDVTFVDGQLLLTLRADASPAALLGTMTFPVVPGDTQKYLDLRWVEAAATNPITPPYAGLESYLVAYDGDTEITVTDNLNGTVNIPVGSVGNNITFGIPYTFKVIPSTVFVRDREGLVRDLERRSINYFEVWANGSDLSSSVAAGKGRTAYAGTWDLTDEKHNERVKIPVMSDAENSVITITDTSPNFLSISRFGWEGRYYPRTREAR